MAARCDPSPVPNRLRVASTVLVALLAAAVLGACGGGGDAEPGEGATASAVGGTKTPPGAGVVLAEDLQFQPAALRIGVGDTVTWRFVDGEIVHNVVFAEGPSSELMSSGTFERTFEEAGTFPYRCTLHSAMKGKITVE